MTSDVILLITSWLKYGPTQMITEFFSFLIESDYFYLFDRLYPSVSRKVIRRYHDEFAVFPERISVIFVCYDELPA